MAAAKTNTTSFNIDEYLAGKPAAVSADGAKDDEPGSLSYLAGKLTGAFDNAGEAYELGRKVGAKASEVRLRRLRERAKREIEAMLAS